MEYHLTKNNNIEDTDSIIERILKNRGFKTTPAIEHYLNTTDEDILDPVEYGLDNLEAAAAMLKKHLDNGSNIFLNVDCDLDGYVSSAIMANYLYHLDSSIIERLFFGLHDDKSHGLLMDNILYGDESYQLVICPDAGSSSAKDVETLKEHGIDIFIADHHQAKPSDIPDCPIMNPQLCDYPTKDLCGAGVVYKFCQYLDSFFNVQYADLFLDLVALAEVGDVMDLRSYEVRRILDVGFNNVRSPFMLEMQEKNSYSLGGKITPTGAAFYIVPFVNAVTRSGTMEEKSLIFQSLLEYVAYNTVSSTKRGAKEGDTEIVVEQAYRVATNVKNRQKRVLDKLEPQIKQVIKSQKLNENKILVVTLPDEVEIQPTLIGLMATKLANEYNKPALVMREVADSETGEMKWSGSGRGLENNKAVPSLKTFLEESGQVERCMGHDNAHGVVVEEDKIADLIDYANDRLKNNESTTAYKVDFIWAANDFDELSAEDILKIANYDYLWGQGIHEPYVVIERIPLTADSITLMSPDKNPTLKIAVNSTVNAIKFKSSKEEYDDLIDKGGYMTIVATANKNEWLGKVSPQLFIQNYTLYPKEPKVLFDF